MKTTARVPRNPSSNGMAIAARDWVSCGRERQIPTVARCPIAYKWRDTLHALNEMSAAGQVDPHDGVLLEYAHPLNGGPTMPTIGCWVQLIPPGVTTKPQRHTSSTIYHVVQGEGVASVGEKKRLEMT